MTAHLMRQASVPGIAHNRHRLMWSCAAAAIVVAAGTSARQAKAQAFSGSPVAPGPNIASDGSASRTITSPTTETITVATPRATINWTPFDNDGSGTIDFLPSGNVATFTNDPQGTADFTVLNRIVPSDSSRPIALNGSVISQLQDLSGATTRGGKVWFYSPGGIVVGATAVFDVGGLLLTVNDPLSFSTTATGFSGNFVAATNSTASVTIDPGARITASPENSYVAVVAPRVVQNGEVNVNGSAAYVAGEDVTLTMNQGLFDIAVNVGTSDPYNPDGPNGIVHTGTTSGPSTTGVGDNHRIYMVAVPKNQALTMLLSGNAGFTPAASASVVNGEIILSAGSNVAETSGTLVVTSPPGMNADLTIGPGSYTSDVRGFARGDIYASADTGSIGFSRDLSLTSLLAGETGIVTVGATNGHSLTVGRNLHMQTSGATFSSGAPEEANIIADGGTVSITGDATMLVGQAIDGTPGDAVISASDDSENSGSITIGGQTLVSTSAAASTAIPDGDSADGFAGDITVEAFNGGTIALHNTQLFASANGQDSGDNGSGFAGDAFGGDIDVSARGGSITITGNLFASADGIGGDMLDGGLLGGGGFGGSIDLRVSVGSVGVTGNVFLSALGVGGDYVGEGISSSAQGGFGSGGDATIFSGGPGSITIGGATTLRSDGIGGDAQSGGGGFGGSAEIYGTDGTIALGAIIDLSARGTGGNANVGFGGDGGVGFGGDALINALAIPPGLEQFAAASTISGGNATIDVTGTGGSGGAGNGDNILPGAGGDGFGGAPCQGECFTGGASAVAQVDGASLTLGNVALLADGVGGTGGAGGNDQAGGAGGQGFGGRVQVGLVDDLFSPSGAPDGEAHYGTVLGLASGNGGNGGAGGSSINGPMPNGDGGQGQGGSASLWSNSLVTAASVTFFANGNGGNGGNGGSASGGSSTITSNDSFIFIDDVLTRIEGLIDIEGDVTVEAAAASGDGPSGTTGDASGGTAEIQADGGDLTIGGDVFVGADGDAEEGLFGGTGDGGLARVDADDGASLSAGSLTVQALGEGGNGTLLAGSGDGGTAQVRARGGASITTDNLTADATATGGASVSGGDAFGGDAEASAIEDGSVLTVTGLVTVKANGIGGTGTVAGVGGSGFGGSAGLYAGVGDSGTGGATVTVNNALLQANGIGGAGSTGGTGYGGGDAAETDGVRIDARLGNFTVTGTLTADADGTGGNGLNGTGGEGLGGNIRAGANLPDDIGIATLTLGTADFSALGTGGAGGGSGNSGGNGEGGEVEVATPTTGSNLNATGLTIHTDGVGGVGGGGASGGAGGDGFGGHARIDLAAGSANLGIIESSARGFGGFGGDGSSGSGGDGGSGFGGLAELTVNSTLNATSYAGRASGLGGNGGIGTTTAGVGGIGGGSSASFDLLATGDVIVTGAVVLSATGAGGAGSDGGIGSGSSASLNIAPGGSLSTSDLFVDANAFGGIGSSGEGGDAFAGYATVANDGDLTVTDQTLVSADAQGGAGTTSGGSGFGSFARVWTSGTGISSFGPATEASAAGRGGSATAGTGGDGTGGFAQLETFGGGTVTGGDATVTANGFGGNGLIGGAGIGGAFFGEGSGGAFIDASGAGSTITFTGTANMSAFGFGGDGTSGTRGSGVGGISTAGVYDGASLNAAGIFIETSGIDGAGTSPAAGTGGSATLEARGGTLAVGGATLLSDGNAQGGDVEIHSTSNFGSGAGDLAIDFLTATANGSAAGNILVTVESGSIADLGVAELTATGQSGGNITIDIGAAPYLEYDGIGTLGLENVVLTANGLTLDTSGDIDIVSQNGASIEVAGTFRAEAAGAMTLDDIDDTAVVSADVIDFSANSFSSTFDILGRVIDISTVLDLDVTGTVLLADETLTLSSQADVLAGDLDAGLSIDLDAGNDIVTGNLDAGQTVTVDAGNNFSVGNVDAGGSAAFTAGRTANFMGVVAAPTITVRSADINIVGQLGEHGLTDLITLNAVSFGEPILIGDDAGPLSEGLQYRLTNDEDIHSETIVFNALNSSEGPTPDVILAGLEMEGSMTAGGGVSQVQLNTGGAVFVDGLVLYTNAGATDLLDINAASIQVNTSSGGRIAMVDSTEERPAGILEVDADHIWVGNDALLDNLNTDPDFAGRDDMVGTNPGPEVAEGHLIAGRMSLSVNETLFVQNSGGPTGFAGITVGDGGLEIRITGEGPGEVVAYGRRFNPDGSFTTGNAFFDLVDFTFDEGSRYTDLSEFNECLINTGCGAVPGGNPFGPGPESILGPVGEMNDPEQTIYDEIGSSDGGSEDISSQLIDTSSLSGDELIDEGVTSGGDSNQWVDPNCRPDDKGGGCPADDGGTQQEPAQ